MQYVLALATLAATCGSLLAKPINRTKHPIYSHILDLRPGADKAWAYDLSNLIYKYSKKYQTDPHLTVAIAMQESGLRNIHRKDSVLVLREECSDDGECSVYSQVVTGYTDIGIYQFHLRTIKYHKLDLLRLLNDIEYATEQHVKLLAAKIKVCQDYKYPWACYHSKTLTRNLEYAKLVLRYYPSKESNNDE